MCRGFQCAGEIPTSIWIFPDRGPDAGRRAPPTQPQPGQGAVGDRAGRDTKILRLVSALRLSYRYSSMVESELNRRDIEWGDER